MPHRMDPKDAIQQFADEIAQRVYGQDFYDLTKSRRDLVYRRATGKFYETSADYADYLLDRQKEGF